MYKNINTKTYFVITLKLELMKKLCFLLISIFCLASCSNDEDAVNPQEPQTPKKATSLTFNDFVNLYQNAGGDMSIFDRINTTNVTNILNLGESSESLETDLTTNGIEDFKVYANDVPRTKGLATMEGQRLYMEVNEKVNEGQLRYEYLSKEELVMITNEAAKRVNINSGYYLVQEVRVHNYFYESNISTDFIMLDSPQCGYIYAQYGLGTVKDKERGYMVKPYSGSSGSMDMSASFVHVLKSKSGGVIDKWIPCHPTQAYWRYGYIFVVPPIKM